MPIINASKIRKKKKKFIVKTKGGFKVARKDIKKEVKKIVAIPKKRKRK